MPPKVKITNEKIIDTAVELVREGGAESLNARALAALLGCSTQPVFSNFATMESLRDEVIRAAYLRYHDFLKAEAESGKYPRYKAYGMAYIAFAREERELFKLLFMRDRSAEDTGAYSPDFLESVEMIMRANGVSRERAGLMHTELWSAVHGIAVMSATSFLSFEWDAVSAMLSDVYQGLSARHILEENK